MTEAHAREQAPAHDGAIVRPVRRPGDPDVPSLAVMVSPRADLDLLVRELELGDGFYRVFMSRLYVEEGPDVRFCLAGPLLGAPYAVMVLEQLVALGARRILFLGWCGSLADSVTTGRLLLPTCAFIDEGTSAHYQTGRDLSPSVSEPSPRCLETLRDGLVKGRHPFSEGPVWTTDAVFRETRQKVERFRALGALAVEMELSALQTAARFREVECGGLLVVSDELFTGTWRPGFHTPVFQEGRRAAVKVMRELCRTV